MAGPEGISASALSREIGVPQPTLSRWLKEARNLEAMKKKAPEKKKAVRPAHRWTPEEKFQVVIRAAQLPEDQLGAFLREVGVHWEVGVHSTQVEGWRKAMLEALKAASKGKKATPETKKIRALEKDLARKEKALAEMAALLALKKNWRSLWREGTTTHPQRTGLLARNC